MVALVVISVSLSGCGVMGSPKPFVDVKRKPSMEETSEHPAPAETDTASEESGQ